ncbi:MAG: type II methionyl aminopeptidase [Candidatus Bathyarchaeota archaeon]|nr:type II methionyl aminopeptidase [Candidatus Bathyarchaeota archaeon]MDW8040421.1 type II methionyl aminopeptidase [Nitrososphaerota archaeon]
MKNINEEAFKNLRLAGRILRETREELKVFVREKMPIIEVCEKAEELIRRKGGKPAFPCNVSINDVAAHYTSPPGDEKRIPEDSLVKVDIGAHVDGYVADTAVTICFNRELRDMVEAAEHALKKAVENIQPNMPTSRLGAIIEQTIKSRGYKPISNLTGHQVGKYLVHAGTSLPNVAHVSFAKVKLGEAYAIEPFVTVQNAAGKVENGSEVTIFRLVKQKPPKNPHAKKLLEHIKDNFKTLPFAERWLQNVVPQEHFKEAFRELLLSKVIIGYPVFIEASGKPVAQAEHTVLIAEDGCLVLT